MSMSEERQHSCIFKCSLLNDDFVKINNHFSYTPVVCVSKKPTEVYLPMKYIRM